MFVVTKLDCLARSISDLVKIKDLLVAKGVTLKTLYPNLVDTSKSTENSCSACLAPSLSSSGTSCFSGSGKHRQGYGREEVQRTRSHGSQEGR